jgi:hypothetical protein
LSLLSTEGHWAILQNIHLVKNWLPSLEKKIEEYSEGSHCNYRIFLSAEPAPNPEQHIIPQRLILFDFGDFFSTLFKDKEIELSKIFGKYILFKTLSTKEVKNLV